MAVEVLEYFHTWTALAHFMLVVAVLAQLIQAEVLVIQQPVVDQQQELVVALVQTHLPLETELQEQQIVEAQVEAHRLVMALISESVAAAVLA
jgi:hypothetical protein